MKPSTFDSSSFFVRISRRSDYLQEALSPHLPKFSRFTCSSHAHIRLASSGDFSNNPLSEEKLFRDHCWILDLTCPTTMEARSSPVSHEGYDILLFTYIQGNYFVFRIFDFQGNQKHTFSLSKTCLCCAEPDLTRDLQAEPISSAIQEAPNLKIATKFKIELTKRGTNNVKGCYVRLPGDVNSLVPFTNKTAEIILVARIGESSMEWKVGYTRYEYNNHRIIGHLNRGWREMARALQLEQGDQCYFNLINPSIWAYEFKVRKQKDDRDAIHEVHDMHFHGNSDNECNCT